MFGLEDLILLYSITAKTSVKTPIVIATTKYATAKKLFYFIRAKSYMNHPSGYRKHGAVTGDD